MENIVAIGDLEGRFKTLEALLKQLPSGSTPVFLGDPNDRGPRTKETIDFLVHNQYPLVQSNHAHMMIHDYLHKVNPGTEYQYYDPGIWFYNGGIQTMESYCPDGIWRPHFEKFIPLQHIEFLQKSPLFIESGDYIFTHAPIHIKHTLKEACDLGLGFANYKFDFKSETSVLWNTVIPSRPNPNLQGKINIFGHNSSKKVKVYNSTYPHGIQVDNELLSRLLKNQKEDPIWAICVDTSAGKKLSGLHLPSMTIYEQEFID